MTDLQEFYEWCKQCGHYQSREAVERFWKMKKEKQNDSGAVPEMPKTQ